MVVISSPLVANDRRAGRSLRMLKGSVVKLEACSQA